MGAIPEELRRSVRERAGDRCEYCRLSQAGQEATFHIDHVVPVAEGGLTEWGNLALACVSCSLRKGARMLVVDPESGEEVGLFHPRKAVWNEHFRWVGCEVEGVTATGRATVAALDLNRALMVAIREEEAHWHRHPPEEV